MKNALALCSLLALLAAPIGCEKKGTPGGPNAVTPSNTSTPSNSTPVVGTADDTFTLDVPNLSTSLKQGETKMVTIGIRRGKNLNEDVALRFTDVPKGLSIDPSAPMINHGDADAKITLKAADDAAIGDFTIGVVGHPTHGQDATSKFDVAIKSK